MPAPTQPSTKLSGQKAFAEETSAGARCRATTRVEELTMDRAWPALGRPPRVAVALGGGGARGIAHVLALESLDELGIRPSAIAGASIGAVLGAPYGAGLEAREIRAHVLRVLRKRSDVM